MIDILTKTAIREHAVSSPHMPRIVPREVLLRGLETAQHLDKLPSSGRAEFVSFYQETTGFPDMEATATKITSHFREAVSVAAGSVGVNILFAGYDPTCSVGKGKALPGSDLDVMTVLIEEGDDKIAEQLFTNVVRGLDPMLADLRSLDPFGIFSLRRLLAYDGSFLPVYGYYISNEGKDWSKEIRHHGSAIEAISQIQSGESIIDNLADDVKLVIRGKAVRNFVKRQFIDVAREKDKYVKRDLLSKVYPNLSINEQFVIVRILEHFNEGVPISFLISSDNPHSSTLVELVEKKILRYKSFRTDEVVVPWIHDSENARVLKGPDWHARELGDFIKFMDSKFADF